MGLTGLPPAGEHVDVSARQNTNSELDFTSPQLTATVCGRRWMTLSELHPMTPRYVMFATDLRVVVHQRDG
jgi:hypothetical protein